MMLESNLQVALAATEETEALTPTMLPMTVEAL
jgi:hypothetical protein